VSVCVCVCVCVCVLHSFSVLVVGVAVAVGVLVCLVFMPLPVGSLLASCMFRIPSWLRSIPTPVLSAAERVGIKPTRRHQPSLYLSGIFLHSGR
jgi:hypothetical protein